MKSVPSQSASTMQRIGWQGRPPQLPEGQTLARVSAQHRAGYEVHDGEHAFNAQPAPKFLKRNIDPAERPAVGDFVVVEGGAPPHIVDVLPRRGMLVRAAAGERYARQIIATNIDVVFVLTGLDGDFNLARIERYLALVEGSGAHPVVLLTKCDAVAAEAVATAVQALRERLPARTPALAINGKDPASPTLLAQYLAPGATAALVGSSGAGKSTLTNTLLGEDRMATAATRPGDDHGRHTTTHRALLPLPGGACLIDTPGMRELKLTGDEDLELFADIDALTEQCRFADCSHATEPGCAVRAALEQGELDQDRWRHYQKLRGQREEQAARFEDHLRGTRQPIRPHRHRDWQERE
ncbi:MAG TPA: ribosome small subunit-dependent GTPase A [Rhodanobacteraceae bacterium]|nr:ribosome small subunit-dependent GTPase A [Rhodanobacteraceae bacterium]